jgi:protein involved in polysaccharide export with SLBB domain
MKNSYPGLIIVLSLMIFSFSVKAAEPTLEQLEALEKLDLNTEEQKDEEYIEIQTSTEKEDDICDDCIYGYDLFTSTSSTFALMSDVPIPPDYMLGSGDKLSLEYIGNENLTKEGFIGRTGVLHLPLLGPITLAGLTFSEASRLITKKVKSELIGTDIFITLSELRSIDIYLVGAAYKPGTYTVSALSTITNVLFASGGPSEVGSLRNIQLKRNGKLVTEFDLYSLLLKGDTSNDMRLQQGDVIFIPLQKATVQVSGDVLRPGIFEIQEGEQIADLQEYTGFRNKNGRIEVNKIDLEGLSRNTATYSLNEKNVLNKLLEDSDAFYITNSSNFISKQMTISGEVVYPGSYSINDGETILSIIERAGGLKDTAYTLGSVFTREEVAEIQKRGYLKSADILEKAVADKVLSRNSTTNPMSFEVLQGLIDQLKNMEPSGRQIVEIDTYLLRSDPGLNFSVQNGDNLYIPPRTDAISVMGEVANQSTHLYRNDLAIEDYINLSGGLGPNADKSQIYIIKPNGQSMVLDNKLFGRNLSNSLLPGSTIYVTQKIGSFDWLDVTSVVTPILADLAMSAATVVAISNNNKRFQDYNN